MLSVLSNIRVKLINETLNLYVSILKCIDYSPFEIKQYVIRSITKIIYELEKLFT